MVTDQAFLKTLTILYVEDEDDTFESGVGLLSRFCATLLTARSGKEGLDSYTTNAPDIIVTDIKMPVMDGLTMVEEIRKGNRDVPIILLTAFERPDYLLRAIEVNVDRYVSKPIQISKLIDSLTFCAHRLRTERERQQLLDEKRIILENVGVGISLVIDRKRKWVNSQFSEMFGYSAEEMADVSTRLIYPSQQDYEQFGAEAYAVLATDATVVKYQQVKRKDGTLFTAKISGTAIDKNRPNDGSIWIFTDVTIQKALEDKLQKSHDLLHTLSHQVPGMIFQFRLFPDGRFCFPYASDSIRELYGCSPEQVREEASALLAVLHPDDCEAHRRSIRVSAQSLQLWQHEYRVVLRGRDIRWYRGNARPEKCADGSVLWHGYVSDVTDQKNLECQLSDSIEAAKRIKAYLQLILKSTDQGIYGIDEAGRFTYINKAGSHMLGYQLDDIIGKDSHSIIHHNHLDGSSFHHDLCPVYRANVTGTSYRSDAEVLWRSDGTHFYSEYSLHHVYDNGIKLGAVVTFRDITERRKKEAELSQIHQDMKKSKETFESIVENMSDWVWEVDSQGRYTYSSSRIENHLGYTPAEIIGKTPFDFMPPEEAEKNARIFIAVLQKQSRLVRIENWNYHKNGTLVLLSTNGVPILDASGNLTGYRGCDKDITKLRQYEDELLKLSRAVAQSPASIMMINLKEEIEFVNPRFSEQTGYAVEDVIGKHPSFLKSNETPVETYTELTAALTAGNIWRGELVSKRKDGSLYWELVSVSPIRNSLGDITNYLTVSEDVTEKKILIDKLNVAKEQADAASRAKSEFLAIMSHEIRTPMNGVIGMSNILLESGLPPEQREYAEIVCRSGENLLVLINDILDFSKIESGKLELEQIEFNLQQVLDDINRLLAYRADDAGLELTYHIDPEVPTFLKGDPGRVRQVVTNLVGNALKFTQKGSVTVTVSLVSDKEDVAIVKFSIIDTGIGIPESRISALFSPFTQVDASTTRKYGGTGLGLAICKQLAELMGGEIGVTSEEEKGSTFWFTSRFEKQIAEAIRAKQTDASSLQDSTLHAVNRRDDLVARILLAENNLINQKVALHMLKTIGHTVDAVADGRQAVEALSKADYDLVLMDCMMPVMNGYEATASIRDPNSNALNHDIPIIAMTANAMKEDRDKCLESGMDDYVSKPVKKNELSAVIDKWLSSTDPLRSKTVDVGNNYLDHLKGLALLYVEDDDETRFQYSQFLSRMVGTLITAKDGAEGLAAYHEHLPDIIITDINMPIMDGLAMIKQVHTHNKSLPAIVLSAFEISEEQRQSDELGDLRHEIKPISGTKLRKALLECANGLVG